MKLYEVLTKIQTELKAPKSQFNKFGGYNYRSCEDILEAVKPLLAKYNACLTISDEIRTNEHAERVYVQATVVFRYGEERLEVQALAREAESKKGMDEAQITGAASSYARKYALAGLFLLDDNKDPDALNKHGKEPKVADNTDDNPLGVRCAHCGELITDTVYGGKNYSAAQICKSSKEKYGVYLHIGCKNAWEEAQE